MHIGTDRLATECISCITIIGANYWHKRLNYLDQLHNRHYKGNSSEEQCPHRHHKGDSTLGLIKGNSKRVLWLTATECSHSSTSAYQSLLGVTTILAAVWYLNGCVDWEGNLGDVDVLLKVEQPHFQLVDLLLHRWHQLVSLSVWHERRDKRSPSKN